jgi:hypothetical protein
MSTASTAPAPIEGPLSGIERITNMFFAPSKTFKDLNRNNSWWQPFLLIAVFAYLFVFAVQIKVGYEQITRNEIAASPKAQERIDKLAPEARENALAMQTKIGKGISYVIPVFQLAIGAIIAAVLLGTFNFGLGTELKFNTVMAIVFYGWVPGILKSVLVAVSLFAGADPEAFNINNPAATNLGYFVSRVDHPALASALSWIDIFTIWYIILFGIGFSCVSRVKRGTAISVVAGWCVIIALVGTGFRALFS